LDALLLSVALERITIDTSCWRRRRLRPEFGNEPQNLLEHVPWDGDLGHLECGVAAVADDLRTDLDQFLLQAR
jgi:hypothetical protein